MENRCQRCNRELSDPNANYGWRCAEILGIDNLEPNLSSEYKIALANSIGRYDLEREAREEGLKILTTGRTIGYENSSDFWRNIHNYGYGGDESLSSKLRTMKFALTHPIIAIEIGPISPILTNISSNSQRFADNSGLRETGGKASGQKNAFRHVLWQATITKRYGVDIATEVGNAHEENPNAIGDRYSLEGFKDVEFTDHLKADEACDLLNNIQGRIVGITTKEEKMNKIALDVIDKYYTDGFWVSKPIGNKKYKITQEKLTEKQYKKIRDNLKRLNKNGYKK